MAATFRSPGHFTRVSERITGNPSVIQLGKGCGPTAQNVVFRSLVLSFIPNALLFDLTTVASSYYFDLGLESNSLGR